MQSRFNGTFADSQMGCQIAVTPVFGIFKKQYLGVPLRQPRKRRASQPLPLVRQKPCQRVGRLIGCRGTGQRLCIISSELSLSPRAAAVLQRLPDRQAV